MYTLRTLRNVKANTTGSGLAAKILAKKREQSGQLSALKVRAIAHQTVTAFDKLFRPSHGGQDV